MVDQKAPRNIALSIGKSADGALRDIRLSRRQSEMLIVGLPILFIWAILSTGLYIHQSISRLSSHESLSEVKQLPLDETTAAIVPKAKSMVAAESNTVVQTTSKASSSEITNILPQPRVESSKLLLRKEVVLGNVFRVQASIVTQPTGTYPQLHLLMSNSTGSLEEGTFWAQVSAIDKQGNEVTFESTRGMSLDSEGKIDNPRKGSRYSIRYQRERTIVLLGPKVEIQRYTKVLLGISRASSGEQIVGKAEL